jgi:hypothetical protein
MPSDSCSGRSVFKISGKGEQRIFIEVVRERLLLHGLLHLLLCRKGVQPFLKIAALLESFFELHRQASAPQLSFLFLHGCPDIMISFYFEFIWI